jgi:SAM-dependent methyltransferase
MIKCPSCEAILGADKWIKKYSFESKEYKLYNCYKCSLQFWYPREKPSADFYEEEKQGFSYARMHTIGTLKLLEYHKTFFNNFKFPRTEMSLLDIGCGDGTFLLYAKKRKLKKIYGVDFDSKSIEVAKKRGVENVYNMNFETFLLYAKKKNIKLDIITFFEVLEHQNNPRVFMQQVNQLLSNNGYVAGSVPNRERFLKNMYSSDFPPHHYFRFDKESLKRLFEYTGFELKVLKTCTFGYVFGLLPSMYFFGGLKHI